MTDTLLIILLLAVMLLATAGLAGTEGRRRRLARRMESAQKAFTQEIKHESAHPAPELSSEEYTRRLIGDEAYARMEKKVEHILRYHRGEKSINVSLTAGPDTEHGREELHRLLPGDPLWMRKNVEGGMDVIDVYSGGYRIGRLMLDDAAKALRIMRTSILTGSYVAEQNCWGNCDDVALGIILFHSSPEEYEARRHSEAGALPYRIVIEGEDPMVLYQN